MGAAEPIKPLTQAEYLVIERNARIKSEFFEGEMFAMSGGTRLHSLIGTNLAREFGNRLKGHKCVPYNGDLRVKVEATGLFTYPDLSIVCGAAQLLDDQKDTLLNPTVIVEVLSDSTEAYDRGKKFEHYRRIPSLREYLLVSQNEPLIEQFLRQQNEQWLLREVAGLKSILDLPSLGIAIALAEVFDGAEFVPTPIRGSVRSSSATSLKHPH
jgi:Uma2 family endonuclease